MDSGDLPKWPRELLPAATLSPRLARDIGTVQVSKATRSYQAAGNGKTDLLVSS